MTERLLLGCATSDDDDGMLLTAGFNAACWRRPLRMGGTYPATHPGHSCPTPSGSTARHSIALAQGWRSSGHPPGHRLVACAPLVVVTSRG